MPWPESVLITPNPSQTRMFALGLLAMRATCLYTPGIGV
jgi:hypothetical protein